MTPLRAITGMIALICALCFAENSFAKRSGIFDEVEIEIITDRRGGLQLFDSGADRAGFVKHYVIARPNEPYRVRITNHGKKRVGVVAAVDGRNILTGHPSTLKAHESMCILAPHQTKFFEGWNIGRHRIDGFVFRNFNNDTGIIALAVFEEQPAGRNKNNHGYRGKNYGSGKSHGRDIRFEPKKRATAKKIIRYASHGDLCHRGIIQCGPKRKQKHFSTTEHRNTGYVSFPSFHLKLQF